MDKAVRSGDPHRLTVVDPDDPTEVYWQLATGPDRAEVLVR
jgi:hypothetical protein